MSPYHLVQQRLARFAHNAERAFLKDRRIGLEKESLRVNAEGSIAQTPHPSALGSALTHPYITTDYSEALIELITPPFTDMREALQFLCETQQYVYSKLENELLWATSMPCVVRGETSIPIARYGRSNPGVMKAVYRRGLGYRYGRTMQVIAGVHFNYSFPDDFWRLLQDFEHDTQPFQVFVSDFYMALIRNLQRFGWLVPYLFGASPAVCKSFLSEQTSTMEHFDANTYYQPYATSLRMGDIGYQNNQENKVGIKACYDSLEAYIDSLTCAITTPCAEYGKIGVKVDGEYRQLNANLLQIENEYYSTIRPKQVLRGNEKPTLALKRRGVRYVELRSLDVNAFDPLGIHEQQIYFLEAFLLLCLLHESPKLSERERIEIDENELAAAHRGRDPRLVLWRDGHETSLKDWGLEICEQLVGICELLDADKMGTPYTDALRQQQEVLRDPDRTPSARMLAEMRANHESFFQFAMRMSRQHYDYFKARNLTEQRRKFFEEEADRSLERQHDLEVNTDLSFDEYLERYFAQQ